ncbi:MAG: hypothetical protein JST19_12005 [Bacteroidetes bacterium]|nr:hypothetical protein [Bacteroidota bacterium]
MKMQDKELDDLFRDKLDDFEAEPSERVWNGIDATINGRNRNKYLLPLLGVAASIVVLVTAGILFVPQNIKPVQQTATLVNSERTAATVKPMQQAVEIKPVVKAQAPVAVRVSNKNTNRYTKSVKLALPAPTMVPVAADETEKADRYAVLTAVAPKQEQATPVDANAGNSFAVKPTAGVDTTTSAITRPTLVAKQTPVQQSPSPQVKKRGIHNFGDLVNVVMAKVDKRKNKALEFSDDEDDQATLTAVNIGPIKIRREDKSER